MPTRLSHEKYRSKDHLISPLSPLRFLIRNHDKNVVMHDHEFIEIVIVLSGRGVHHSINGNQQLAAGDVFVLRPGVWHAYTRCQKLQIFNCLITQDFFESNLHFVRKNPLLRFLLWPGRLLRGKRGVISLHLKPRQLARCRTFISALTATQNSHALLEVTGNLLLLLSCLTECISEEQLRQVQVQPHEMVLKAIKLLETSFAYDWTLQELAQKIHLNHCYLVRIFKDTTGLSPIEYLAHYRLEQAARLLLNTDFSIARIGSEVGWHNSSYFAKRFKAYFEVTATEYRAQFNHF